jgi:hypothetical protein
MELHLIDLNSGVRAKIWFGSSPIPLQNNERQTL